MNLTHIGTILNFSANAFLLIYPEHPHTPRFGLPDLYLTWSRVLNMASTVMFHHGILSGPDRMMGRMRMM
jgi:hypothetical protein